jgi:hypothetical protein
MAFKSDRQRKAVMAKLNQGSVRSDVKPVLQPTGKNKMAKRKSMKGKKYRTFRADNGKLIRLYPGQSYKTKYGPITYSGLGRLRKNK